MLKHSENRIFTSKCGAQYRFAVGIIQHLEDVKQSAKNQGEVYKNST